MLYRFGMYVDTYHLCEVVVEILNCHVEAGEVHKVAGIIVDIKFLFNPIEIQLESL